MSLSTAWRRRAATKNQQSGSVARNTPHTYDHLLQHNKFQIAPVAFNKIFISTINIDERSLEPPLYAFRQSRKMKKNTSPQLPRSLTMSKSSTNNNRALQCSYTTSNGPSQDQKQRRQSFVKTTAKSHTSKNKERARPQTAPLRKKKKKRDFLLNQNYDYQEYLKRGLQKLRAKIKAAAYVLHIFEYSNNRLLHLNVCPMNSCNVYRLCCHLLFLASKLIYRTF